MGAASLGGDAAAVFNHDQHLPTYFELVGSVRVQKPTAGWKANAYVIFDYHSPTDFKFAGINVSTNKIEMGRRTTEGWMVEVWTPMQVAFDRSYAMLVAINGTTVTVLVDGRKAFTHTFAARVVDGFSYGLNAGMVGVGSDNSRGVYDNVAVQVLPPQVTLDHLEDFDDGVANLFTGAQTGTWQVTGGRYVGSASVGSTGMSLVDLGRRIAVNSYLELSALLRSGGIGGLVFDRYADKDFKFVALDVAAQRVLIGHHDPRRGWIVDQAISRTLSATTDHTLQLSFRGPTVAVLLDGQTVASFAYNAAVVDGAFGVLTLGATTSFDWVRVKTDDPAFAEPAAAMTAATSATADASTVRMDEATLAALVEQATAIWTQRLGADDPRLAALHGLRFAIADLAGQIIGYTAENTIYLDVDAAGHGWDSVDALEVVVHELGHVLGFDHDDADLHAVMSPYASPASGSTAETPGEGSDHRTRAGRYGRARRGLAAGRSVTGPGGAPMRRPTTPRARSVSSAARTAS